jgi:hypothetical protein
MKRPGITAEQVRAVLLALAADEVRLARVEPRPLTIGALLDHANAGTFCRSIAREANDNARVRTAEMAVAEHLRRRP